MLVIIPCGQKKCATTTTAGRMYTGPYHRACLGYARSIVPDAQILILSGKYGLLPLDRPIIPYETKITDADAISITTLYNQAVELEILDTERVIGLGGKGYTRLIGVIWPHVETPLSGLKGMGYHMQWLKQHHWHLP